MEIFLSTCSLDSKGKLTVQFSKESKGTRGVDGKEGVDLLCYTVDI